MVPHRASLWIASGGGWLLTSFAAGCKAKECEPEEAKPRLVCTDLLREANKGINPVTIGDVTVLANGDIAYAGLPRLMDVPIG
jgi:hypothetical protein